jgi:hypothetical protein
VSDELTQARWSLPFQAVNSQLSKEIVNLAAGLLVSLVEDLNGQPTFTRSMEGIEGVSNAASGRALQADLGSGGSAWRV